MNKKSFDIIVIGGSAGSIKVVIALLKSLPKNFKTPIVLIIHRLKNTVSHLDQLISKDAGVKAIIEPEDKEQIIAGNIYLAPQNYHLLVEQDHSFSLDYSELVHYSRPSIDVSFDSFSNLYGKKMLAILLSGANKDGSASISHVLQRGGSAIVQLPESAEYPVMPKAAIELNKAVLVKSPKQIVDYLTDLMFPK
jgi:two-component system, chemotaxis family, protein-glutamate methylesterase/glutaminase